MDVAWIILDSVSFESTPFAENGPNTMPKLSSLAKESGIIFTRAYAPGPTSPSSHGSFFTGKLPSETNMHEANPYFNSDIQTIGDVLDHEKFGISTNPFIFNGLCDSFESIEDLSTDDYLMFESGSDPANFVPNSENPSEINRYYDFITSSEAPLRSLINGAWYKTLQMYDGGDLTKSNHIDDENYQYANSMNEIISDKLVNESSDLFVVANYMDAHPPLDASNRALEKFAPEVPKGDLPVGVSGQVINDKVNNGDEQAGELMDKLYKSTIWDLDRKVEPLIREFLDRDSLVILTADHGNWFKRDRELDEERIHVPLVIFTPKKDQKVIDKTVNLRSLPRTTMEFVEDDNCGFEGVDLTEVTEHQISITELIHDPEEPGSPVHPQGKPKQQVQYDMAAIKGETRVDRIADEINIIREEDGNIDKLKEEITKLRERRIDFTPEKVDINAGAQERLEKLGYL